MKRSTKTTPKLTTRDNERKSVHGKDIETLITLFPPGPNQTSNLPEFTASLREYLNKAFPKLASFVDTGVIGLLKLQLLSQ